MIFHGQNGHKMSKKGLNLFGFLVTFLSKAMVGNCLGSQSNPVLAFSCKRSDQGALSKPFHKSLHSEKIASDILPLNIYIPSFVFQHLCLYTYNLSNLFYCSIFFTYSLLSSHIPYYGNLSTIPYIERHIKFHR